MTDDLHSLAAAYVLDALDDDERRRFEAHLETCDDCAVDVVDLREAAASLAADAPMVAPPPSLKASVMAQIAATPQVPAATAAETAGETASVAASNASPDVVAMRPRRSGPPRWITLAAAAVVVAVVGFGTVIALGGDDDEPAPDPTELAAELLEAPDAVTVEMQGDAPGSVKVMYSAAEQRAVLLGDGLDAPGPDRVYQLWTISGDEPTPSMVFTPDEGEFGEEMDMTVDPPEVWAITIEPTGGSPAPTGDVMFSGTAA
ncbi:MAG: anti-sigma factor [Actinomycetota bacterium]|nr:anti-sigma factor [Actinomycetota bacterium]